MDVKEYLERIGYDGPLDATVETLHALHRAHLATVPYENLDIQLGTPIPLTDEAVFDKIVRRRRGGYCYELNGAFAQLATALGFHVTYGMAAVGPRDGTARDWGNHLVLLVHIGRQTWIADVGLGDGFLEPLPLRGGWHRQGPFRYLVEVGDECWVGHHVWGAVAGYWMRTEPLTLGHFAPYHRRQSTSPDSAFMKTLLVQQPRADHTLTLRAASLTTAGPAGKTRVYLLTHADFVAVLADEFGVPVDEVDTVRLFALAREQTRVWSSARGIEDPWGSGG